MCTRVMYSLFNGGVSTSDCVVLNDRLNDDLVRMQKEAATVYFESKHFSGATEENHIIPCCTTYILYLPLFIYSTPFDVSFLQILNLLLSSVLLFVPRVHFQAYVWVRSSTCSLLYVGCLAHFLTLKIEVVHYSETLMSQRAQHSIPEDSVPHIIQDNSSPG